MLKRVITVGTQEKHDEVWNSLSSIQKFTTEVVVIPEQDESTIYVLNDFTRGNTMADKLSKPQEWKGND